MGFSPHLHEGFPREALDDEVDGFGAEVGPRPGDLLQQLQVRVQPHDGGHGGQAPVEDLGGHWGAVRLIGVLKDYLTRAMGLMGGLTEGGMVMWD